MNRNGPTPIASRTVLVTAKFAPHTAMIAMAAARESCEAEKAIEAGKVHEAIRAPLFVQCAVVAALKGGEPVTARAWLLGTVDFERLRHFLVHDYGV